MEFKDLSIIQPIRKALSKEDYSSPTPIQEQAIPVALQGRDVLGCAQTGTGKTAAFAIPTLQRLCMQKQTGEQKNCRRPIRSLVLSPTRELAQQIHHSFCVYGRYTGLRFCVIHGGVSQKPQETALKNGIDVLIATPGRLEDLISQGFIDLRHVEILTLDEADMMLDMGFIHAVKRIVAATPSKRQTLLFSATVPPGISKIARDILSDPVKISIAPDKPAVEAIKQQVYFVDKMNKLKLLMHLLKGDTVKTALVFTRTKHGADRVVRKLYKGNIRSEAIHGNKSQNARQKTLGRFKKGAFPVLVATDIAARGLDIDEISHVINFDLPQVPETYVHRIGRTGRAGHGGIAISFCDIEEKKLLKNIERLLRVSIPTKNEHPFPMRILHVPPKQPRAVRKHQRQDNEKKPGTQRKGQHSRRRADGGRRYGKKGNVESKGRS